MLCFGEASFLPLSVSGPFDERKRPISLEKTLSAVFHWLLSFQMEGLGPSGRGPEAAAVPAPGLRALSPTRALSRLPPLHGQRCREDHCQEGGRRRRGPAAAALVVQREQPPQPAPARMQGIGRGTLRFCTGKS